MSERTPYDGDLGLADLLGAERYLGRGGIVLGRA